MDEKIEKGAKSCKGERSKKEKIVGAKLCDRRQWGRRERLVYVMYVNITRKDKKKGEGKWNWEEAKRERPEGKERIE